MRGLTVIVTSADRARFRAALGLVAAQAALGGGARLYLDGAAVALFAAPAEDAAESELPGEAELLDTALALGAHILLCQTGLAAAGLDLRTLDTRLEIAGMIELLTTLGEDRLVAL